MIVVITSGQGSDGALGWGSRYLSSESGYLIIPTHTQIGKISGRQTHDEGKMPLTESVCYGPFRAKNPKKLEIQGLNRGACWFSISSGDAVRFPPK
jgi:hypothetical protein